MLTCQVGKFEEWSKRTGQDVLSKQAAGIQKNWKVEFQEYFHPHGWMQIGPNMFISAGAWVGALGEREAQGFPKISISLHHNKVSSNIHHHKVSSFSCQNIHSDQFLLLPSFKVFYYWKFTQEGER